MSAEILQIAATILTEADKALIRADVERSSGDSTPQRVDSAFRKEAIDTAKFYGTLQAEWTARILSILTDDTFRPPEKRRCGSHKMRDVREAFDQQVKETLEDAIEEFPERYKNIKPSEENHPWGADVIKRCRAVLNLSPYRLWRFVSTVQGLVHEIVNAHLPDLVHMDPQGEGIAQSARSIFEIELKKLISDIT